jgi:hydroxyacylglutathione hydrolase
VVDPGGNLPKLRAEVARPSAALKPILLTHAQTDPAGGTGTLAPERALPIVGPHPGDPCGVDRLAEQARLFGFAPAEPFTPTCWLADGDCVMVGHCTLTVGHCTLTARHCPGHPPGRVVFYSAQAQRAFVGDVLFAGSIGRTDFPGSDHDTLIRSIAHRLWPMGDGRWPMGDATVFIPAMARRAAWATGAGTTLTSASPDHGPAGGWAPRG